MKNLDILSRDHQDTLLFIWRLRKGVRNGTDMVILKNYIQHFFQEHIEPHTHDEEEILSHYKKPKNKKENRVEDEHESVEELIDYLLNKKASTLDQHLVSLLCDLLFQHIEFEENILFPALKKSDTKKPSFGKTISVKRRKAKVWEDRFWEKE